MRQYIICLTSIIYLINKLYNIHLYYIIVYIIILIHNIIVIYTFAFKYFTAIRCGLWILYWESKIWNSMYFDVFMGILLVWSQTDHSGTSLKDHSEFNRFSHWPRIQSSCRLLLVLGQRKLIIPQWMPHINMRPPLCHQDMKYVGHSSSLNLIYSKPGEKKSREKLELSVLWYYGDQRWKVQGQKSVKMRFHVQCSSVTK